MDIRMETCNNLLVKHADYFKLIFLSFVFKPELGYYILNHKCFIIQRI